MLTPLSRRADVMRSSRMSLIKLVGWFTLSLLILYFLASTIYLLVRTQPEFATTELFSDESELQTLVDDFARTVTRQDWKRNAQLFAPGSTLDFHRAFTFLTDFPLLSANNALVVSEDLGFVGSWGQQMAVFAGSLASNHLLIGNCNFGLGSHIATLDCIGIYSYTLNYDTSLFTNNFATQFVVFQPQFNAAKQTDGTWLLTQASALINATNTLLSSVETGAAPPGGVFTRRKSDPAALRAAGSPRTPADTWSILNAQLDALVAQGQIDTARAICRTNQYITLAATFDPYANGTALQCNVIMRAPISIDSPMVCGPNGSINASCLVGDVGTNAIETINSITPLPVMQDFTITGGIGIAISGNMHGITINNVGLLVITLNAPFPFYFTKTITMMAPAITLHLNNTSANTVWAGPTSGSPTQPTFRSLVVSDLPLIPLASHVTGVLPLANGGTNNAGPWVGNRIVVSAPGGTQLEEAGALPTGYFLMGDSGSLIAGTIAPGPGINISLSGGVFTVAADMAVTVVQVDLAVPTDIFQVTSAPILVNGTLTFVTLPQAANTVWAGPTSGGPAVPSFRALVASDLPSVSLSSGVSGTLPVGNGGTGNAGPYAGTSVIFSNSGGTSLVEGTVVGTGGISVSLSGAGPTLTISGTGGTCAANDTISQSCLDISTLSCPNGALDATCMPSTLTLAALTVTGPATLGTSTTCAAPLAAPCYDISAQSCPGGYLNANCINPNLVLSSLTVTNLTATDIMLLNGTVTVTGVSNFEAVNASTLYTNSIVLAGAMTCSPEDTISQNCYDISGISCTTPVSANCFPINMTFSDASVTNLLEVNNVACLGTPLGNDCIPPRVRTINGISPSAAPALDFTIAAGTGIAIASITNGITVSNTGVTSVGLSLPLSVFSLSGTPVVTTGTLTAALVSQTANTVWAAPDGSNGAPSFRALLFSDLPVLGTNSIYYVDGAGNLTAASLSLALSVPSAEFAISGSPITSPTGTFTVTKQTQTARTFWAGPMSGSPAQPTFRTISTGDLTALGLLDNELLIGVTGGAPVAASLVAGNNVNITYGPGTITVAVDNTFGTVTSVGLSLPGSVFSVSGSPVISSGTLTGAFVAQNSNTFFAGPSSGGPATPAFRAMTYADLPALADGQLYIGVTGGAPIATQLTAGTLITITPAPGTSTVSTTALGMVTLSMPAGVFSVASSTGPNTQTLTVSLGTQTANTVWAGPTTGPAAAPTFRSLVAADVPNLDASKITTGVLPIARGGTNSGTALSNGALMVSSGGAIVEGTSSTTPTFASETLSAMSNQLVLGTTQTITLTAPTPAASRTYTIPDAGAAAWFVMDTGGALTITNTPTAGQVLTGVTSTTASWATPTVGTVTSVALALPVSVFSISGSPVISSGTLTGAFVTQTANTVFAGPTTGIPATPTFRTLVAADVPSLDASKITTGVLPIARGGTNSATALNNNRIMVSSGGAIVEAAALTNGQLLIGSTGAAPVAATLTGTTNQVNVVNAAGSITLSTPQNIHTAATPTFASETLSATSNQLTLGTTTTTTITAPTPAGSRTYTISDAGANANFVMDSAAALTITNAGSVGQVLTLATATTATWQTVTGTGSVTSVGLSLPASVFSVSGSPVTTMGTLTGTFQTQTANTFFAGPTSGGAATPTFRALVTADLPVAILLSYSEATSTTAIMAFSTGSYTTVTSMTLTPTAGTYWCSFSTSIVPSTSSGVFNVALHLNAVIVGHSKRTATGSSSYFNIHTLAVITTPGGQPIDVRWQKSSGSGTADMRERSLYCLRIG